MIPLTRILLPSLIFILGFKLTGAFPAVLRDSVVSVPDGTTNHGDAHTLCTSATAFDILVFFFTNYFAHAVTVKSYAGESGAAKHLSYLAALFFPASGLVRGLHAFARRAILAKGPLERAVRSGALCMVVRNEEWEPEDGLQVEEMRLRLRSTVEEKPNVITIMLSNITNPRTQLQVPLPTVFSGVFAQAYPLRILFEAVIRILHVWNPALALRVDQAGTRFWNSMSLTGLLSHLLQELQTHRRTVLATYIPQWAAEASSLWSFQDTIEFYVNMNSRRIHGAHRLPAGYSFAHVPRDAKVAPLVPGMDVTIHPQSSTPKSIAAVVQGFYSSFTLYSARGEQVHTYGYTAFGLTVLPYTVMTLFNLIGNLLTPDYSTLYLVESPTMLEAQKRQSAVFKGAIGRLIFAEESDSPGPNLSGPSAGVVPEFSATFEEDVDELGIRNTHIRLEESRASHILPPVPSNFLLQSLPPWMFFFFPDGISPAGTSLFRFRCVHDSNATSPPVAIIS
ncbi:hypothetical protein K438DRAFT_2020309 [Mycena galopus ATCC 62051]|nr:hypothetical protein K438DRAFT_2020309 [Mycena galopus ATCC 62051]